MIRHDAFLYYTREYLHALRNGDDSTEAASKAMNLTKKFYIEHTKKTTDAERLEEWAYILLSIVDWETVLRFVPIEVEKIPPKEEMPKLEIEIEKGPGTL